MQVLKLCTCCAELEAVKGRVELELAELKAVKAELSWSLLGSYG